MGNQPTTDDASALGRCLASIAPVIQITRLMPRQVIDDALAEVQRADTLGPILDPTAYMRGATNMHHNANIIHAFAEFHKRLAEIADAAIVDVAAGRATR